LLCGVEGAAYGVDNLEAILSRLGLPNGRILAEDVILRAIQHQDQGVERCTWIQDIMGFFSLLPPPRQIEVVGTLAAWDVVETSSSNDLSSPFGRHAFGRGEGAYQMMWS
jgi:hypothetical protein